MNWKDIKRFFKKLFAPRKSKVKKLGWNDLTLLQYEELRLKTYNIPQEQYTNVAIEVLLGIKDPETSIPYTEYLQHVEELNFLTKAPQKNKLQEKYTLNGKVYTLDMNLQDFSVVQFQDFTTYTKQRPSSMIDMLSVVLVPEGAKYNDGSYDLEKAKEDIGSMSVCDGEAIINFFFLWFKRLLAAFQCSLDKYLRKMEKKGTLTEEQKKVLEIMKQKMTLMNLMVESMA